jgi:hypothetical protein
LQGSKSFQKKSSQGQGQIILDWVILKPNIPQGLQNCRTIITNRMLDQIHRRMASPRQAREGLQGTEMQAIVSLWHHIVRAFSQRQYSRNRVQANVFAQCLATNQLESMHAVPVRRYQEMSCHRALFLLRHLWKANPCTRNVATP